MNAAPEFCWGEDGIAEIYSVVDNADAMVIGSAQAEKERIVREK